MRSMRTRLTLTYVLFSVLIITVLGVLFSLEIERYYFDRLLGNLRTETKILAAVLQEGGRGGGLNVEKELNAISSASLMRISLVDSSGVVLYDSSVPDSLLHALESHAQRPEILEAKAVGTGSNIRRSHSIDHDMVYMARRINSVSGPTSAFPSL